VVEAGRAVPEPSRYWRAPIPPRGQHRGGSFQQLAGELREVLSEASKGHARADVPVTAAVSGGLDSSLVVALSGVKDVFSLCFPDDPDLDESRFVPHARRVDMTAAAAQRLPEMIAHLEVPMLMPGAIGGLLLSQRMRAEGFKVTLTGDGADELLGGYDVFRAAKARRLFGERPVRWVADLLRAPPPSWGADPPWFPQTLLLGGRIEPPEGWSKLLRDDRSTLDPLDAQIAIELETRLPSWILVISDRSYMAHGVEARVPFLDDRVVPFILSLPPSMKLRLLREKAILREAARGLVPKAITRRRKQPFMTPIAPWFFAHTPEALRAPRIFDPEEVARALQRLPAAKGWERRGLELRLMLMLGTELLARQGAV
jgi:asparagine synthase (glutamine-hydrolysing)